MYKDELVSRRFFHPLHFAYEARMPQASASSTPCLSILLKWPVGPPKDMTKPVTKLPQLTTGYYLLKTLTALSRRPLDDGSILGHDGNDTANKPTWFSRSQ